MIEARVAGNKIELRFSYNPAINAKLKTLKGRWNPDRKCWEVYIDRREDLEALFTGLLVWKEPSVDMKTWDENNIDISVVDDLKLKPYAYQLVGGSAFLPTVKTGLLADEVGLGKCLAPEARVLLNGSYMPIEKIWEEYSSNIEFDGEGYWSCPNKDIYIQTYDKGRIRSEKVQKLYKQQISEKIVKIKLANDSSIRATKAHKFLTLDGWKNNLSIDDFIAVPERVNLTEGFTSSSISYAKIVSIEEEEYSGFVYDLSIRETHNFIAEGMLCHNTAQVFVAFQQLYNHKKVKKALVFCKKSLVLQWLSELEKFTSLKGIAIIGDTEERARLYKEAEKPEYQFVFLNYELLIADYKEEPIEGYKRKVKVLYNPIEELVRDHIDIIVLDEAQKIKNWKTQTSKRMKSLRDLVEYRWLLSGTPLENSPEDIYNLFLFMNPSVLGTNPVAFRKRYLMLGRFNQPLGTKNLGELRERILPYMLRRVQSQVDHEFPELRIDEVRLEMSGLQKQLHKELNESIYNEIKGLPDELSFDIDKVDEGNSILGKFVLLMQVANNPGLLLTSESEYARKILKKVKPSKTDLNYSPKYDWILNFLNERRDSNPNAKTVIFSRYERVVSQLAKLLTDDGFKVVTHTGAMSQEEREISKKSFWQDAQIFISSDAGAEGLNLQCADCLINIELPWNSSKFIQRWGRIKRAGSEFKKVRVVNLLCEGSIDERVKQIFYTKEDMFNQVVEGSDEEKKQINRLTRNVLLKLVSKGKKQKE